MITALTGPFAGLILALLGLYALATIKWIVPAPMYKKSEERVGLLEEENQTQQDLLLKQSEQISEQKSTNARLEERVLHLTSRVEQLTKEIHSLRGELKDTP